MEVSERASSEARSLFIGSAGRWLDLPTVRGRYLTKASIKQATGVQKIQVKQAAKH